MSNPAGMQSWRDRCSVVRSPYVFLLAVFTLSRILYYMLGVRFDARGVTFFLQFLDPALLQHRLFESLLYLHMQPPGYNLFLGIILKLFPHAYGAAFHAIHLVFGAVITCLLFYLMRSFGTGVRLALTATILFVISPGVVLYENWILYEYQMAFTLLLSAVFLYRFFLRRSAASAAGFLVCQFWLLMIRNYFNVVYVAAIFILLLFLTKHNRRAVAAAGSLLLALILGVYLKNQILFGQFTSSTGLGMNMVAVTCQLTSEERRTLASQGTISPVSTISDILAPLSKYRPYITMPPKTGIQALDQELKPSGFINLNHPGFIEVGKLYMKDALSVIRHYPKAYARMIASAWFSYFLPADDMIFFDLNHPHIHGIQRFFDVVFFGQLKQAPDRKVLKQLRAQGATFSLVLYSGIFLLIGLPVLFTFGAWFLYRGVRRHLLRAPQALLLGFMLFNIAYITMVVNFLSTFENNRYRFPVDGFYLLLAVLAIDRIRRAILSRAHNARGGHAQ
ncbi:MAG: hypothetical protein JW768_08500 [Chitinispirillaceae bacterium]|nr:hypothetical protein [Chitinispirillaceae bacterium]